MNHHMPCLPGIFSPPPKAWKRQRSTAREVYAVIRDRDKAKAAAGEETREAQVLRCVAAHWNATQVSPTALELLAWMRSRGESAFDVNSIRPRITALVDAGLMTSRGKRRCSVSGKTVYVWGVVER